MVGQTKTSIGKHFLTTRSLSPSLSMIGCQVLLSILSSFRSSTELTSIQTNPKDECDGCGFIANWITGWFGSIVFGFNLPHGGIPNEIKDFERDQYCLCNREWTCWSTPDAPDMPGVSFGCVTERFYPSHAPSPGSDVENKSDIHELNRHWYHEEFSWTWSRCSTDNFIESVLFNRLIYSVNQMPS